MPTRQGTGFAICSLNRRGSRLVPRRVDKVRAGACKNEELDRSETSGPSRRRARAVSLAR